MDYNLIKMEIVERGIALLTLNRPQVFNALNLDILKELTDAAKAIASDHQIRILMLTGQGNSFCTGGDINALDTITNAPEGREFMHSFYCFLSEIANMEKPVIAAVNGFAYGGGFSVALASDFIIAADDAKFCLSFLNVGLVPDGGSIYFLARSIGLPKTRELAFTRREITAGEAERLGIVNKVVRGPELIAESLVLARQFETTSRIACGYTKKLANQAFNLGLDQFLEVEAFAQAVCFQTDEHRDAVKAFFKRGGGT